MTRTALRLTTVGSAKPPLSDSRTVGPSPLMSVRIRADVRSKCAFGGSFCPVIGFFSFFRRVGSPSGAFRRERAYRWGLGPRQSLGRSGKDDPPAVWATPRSKIKYPIRRPNETKIMFNNHDRITDRHAAGRSIAITRGPTSRGWSPTAGSSRMKSIEPVDSTLRRIARHGSR